MTPVCVSGLDRQWSVLERSAEVNRRCWDLFDDGWHGPSLGNPGKELMHLGEDGIKAVLKGLLFEGKVKEVCLDALRTEGGPHLQFLGEQLTLARQVTNLRASDVKILDELEAVLIEISGGNPGTPSLNTSGKKS